MIGTSWINRYIFTYASPQCSITSFTNLRGAEYCNNCKLQLQRKARLQFTSQSKFSPITITPTIGYEFWVLSWIQVYKWASLAGCLECPTIDRKLHRRGSELTHYISTSSRTTPSSSRIAPWGSPGKEFLEYSTGQMSCLPDFWERLSGKVRYPCPPILTQ